MLFDTTQFSPSLMTEENEFDEDNSVIIYFSIVSTTKQPSNRICISFKEFLKSKTRTITNKSRKSTDVKRKRTGNNSHSKIHTRLK